MTHPFFSLRRFAAVLSCGLCLATGPTFASNPMLEPSGAPYGAPQFDRIRPEHLLPAIEAGIEAYRADIDRILALRPEEATFENVVVALSQAGRLLRKSNAIVSYLKSNFGSDSISQLAMRIAPLVDEAYNQTSLNPRIFELVRAVYERRDESDLDSLQLRTLKACYRSYVRQGALCTPEEKKRLQEISQELSLKRLRHSQNITRATQQFVHYVTDSTLLEGLTASRKRRLAEHAARLGHPGSWAIGFTNNDYGAVMHGARNRDLRRVIYTAYTTRCTEGEYDNSRLSVEIANLRLERAQILGYETYADYVLETNMAENPRRVYDLLLPLKEAAIAKSASEYAELEAFAANYEHDTTFRLRPWDMDYYASKLSKERFGSVSARLRKYLLFENVLHDGVFYAARRLFGIRFAACRHVPVYHPDVLVFEARNASGEPLGLLYLDCFARTGKRSGAWCSRLRGYSRSEQGEELPLVTVSCNFSRAAEGAPQLLSVSEVETLFHEFGHALATFFARGPYPQVTGGLPRDMVELPSQLNEHWAWEPQVVKHYARNYRTGRPVSMSVLDELAEERRFQSGLYRTDYYASTLLDLAWHTIREPIGTDVEEFEQELLSRYGFPAYTRFRYRTTYYNHIFGGSYASQYYAYTWAAVLETDAFACFSATGNCFDPETAARYKRCILTESGYDDPMKQYVRFSGREPDATALMKSLGLIE